MALAHRRLGIAVTVIQRSTILPHDEAELVAILRVKLEASGICLLEQASVRSAFHDQRRVELVVERAGATERIVGSHLLVATGRQPNIDDLGLDDAGVRYGSRGIVVDARLRTSQRHIFALGDAIDGPRFTHAAGYQAGIVIRNVAFRIPAKVDYAPLPWATYTDPELAHVGLGEAVARTKFGKNVRTVLLPLGENDRAVTERRTDGAIKIVVGPRGRILGSLDPRARRWRNDRNVVLGDQPQAHVARDRGHDLALSHLRRDRESRGRSLLCAGPVQR